MKYHVTGSFWMLDRTAKPFLELTKEDGVKEYLHLKRDMIVSVKEEFGKRCTGFFKDGKHSPCPSSAQLLNGRQCDSCRLLDDFNVCARCNGSECNANGEMRKNCFEKTHFLYFALIGDKVKVGITHAARYLKRWIEQGADYACIVSSGNGLDVRKKEHLLSREVADRVFNKEKMRLFMKDNREILDNFLKEKNVEANIVDVRKFYDGLDRIPKMPLVHDGIFTGRIVCVKGKIVVFESGDEYYYYDLNKLVGSVAELEWQEKKP